MESSASSSTPASTSTDDPLSDDWCAHHFDHLSPELASDLHETLSRMRAGHPVARSDRHGGFWVVTRRDDVLRVAQDWQTFSSAHGVGVPYAPVAVPAIPEHVDPPRQKAYRQIINAYFTPKAVAGFEQATAALVDRLIDGFVDDGTCDFMADFARPFPGLSFFDLVLGAPADDVAMLNDATMRATNPLTPDRAAAWSTINEWIDAFVARRRSGPRRDDVVDAILAAHIDGEPLTHAEIIGMIQLLILGGLDTTAGALGAFMIRFCADPEIPSLLRRSPELIPTAIEELLRLDGPFLAIARTATNETEIGGRPIAEGDRVLIYWASANRDEDEFGCPHAFDLDRERNRHLAFGAGPHRCAGSHLARMNLRIAVDALVRRLEDLALRDPAQPIPFHSVLNRTPLEVPITFTAASPREVR
jgi:cytochrome P450